MKYLYYIKKTSRTFLLWLIIFIQSIFLQLSLKAPYINAQEPSTEQSSEVIETTQITEVQAPVENTQGPQEPTGAENRTYSYNEETGLWENDFYTWDPVTKLTSPKTESNYSYNPETGRWDTTEWIYTPESGKYTPQTVSIAKPVPSSDISHQSPTNSSETSQPVSNSPATSPKPSNLKSTASLLNGLDSQNGPGSLSVKTYDSSNKGYFDNFFNAKISVSINSNTTTGDASVLQNTIGGNALTGDASSMATIMNLVQSAWGVSGIMPYMYTENIQGDYYGDIFLDPTLLKVGSSNSSDEIIVNSTQDVAIVNDIELSAESGNALVQKNTQAGSATSGDATAILNLMNVINSSMATGQSFIGMLNVFGNLEGDVLLPANLLDSLIASNVPTTDIQLTNEIESDLELVTQNEQTIDNYIKATASSGDAVVANNTSAGDAESGNASTNVTVFNLTGSHVVADQALLVFVQVMGEWIGFITNAPTNSNVALLGGGVESNQKSINAEYDINNKSLIDNNVSINAATGSASVLNNTTGGGATTGDANAVANITNITNSSFSLSNWFGLLFINVFGDWSGSFGTNTPFGSILAAANSNPSTNANSSQSTNNTNNVPIVPGAEPSADVRVFAVSFGGNSSGGTSVTSATPVMEEDVPLPTEESESEEFPKVAGAFTNNQNNTPNSSEFPSLVLTTILVGLIGLIIFRRFQLA